jgi:hypothetical protein
MPFSWKEANKSQLFVNAIDISPWCIAPLKRYSLTWHVSRENGGADAPLSLNVEIKSGC